MPPASCSPPGQAHLSGHPHHRAAGPPSLVPSWTRDPARWGLEHGSGPDREAIRSRRKWGQLFGWRPDPGEALSPAPCLLWARLHSPSPRPQAPSNQGFLSRGRWLWSGLDYGMGVIPMTSQRRRQEQIRRGVRGRGRLVRQQV